MFNHKKDSVDERDYKFFLPAADLPKKVDFSYKMPGVVNQKNLGSCTANSVGYNVNYMCKNLKLFRSRPSRLFIYANSRILDGTPLEEDSGTSLRTAFKSIAKFGVCDEVDWDYIPKNYFTRPIEKAYSLAKKCARIRYSSVMQEEDAIKGALAAGFPISCGIQVFESFMKNTQTGMIPMPLPLENHLGGHAITLVGYCDKEKQFMFMNSWGTAVGLPYRRGFFKIPYDYILGDLAADFWICESIPL